MIADELKYRILQSLGHPPTAEQEQGAGTFAQMMCDGYSRVAMILRGSAGTGKTTLAAAIVRAMMSLRQKIVLLAPTGRAAKVLSLNAGMAAYTIHRRIYRQKMAGDMSAFNLNVNLQGDTLFVIDEASMISLSASSSGDGSVFGSGCLLDDLVQYVYGADNNCRMLLIGDRAQLPPVGEEESGALTAAVIRAYGLTVYEADLSEVLRQSRESGILYNATVIRQMMARDGATQLPRIRFRTFPDIVAVPGDELIESLATSYSRVGQDDTIVVTRSNKRANIFNQGIRRTVIDREEELCRGDRLMIVKNNYYWTAASLSPEEQRGEAHGQSRLSFLANGDVAAVQRIRRVHEQYGFRFAEVTLQFPDYDDYELTATVLLDTLTSESPSLTREQQQQLYDRVMEDYADIPLKKDRLAKLRQDRYYNALQVKFAYAVTCHKAQGGQWAHVYVDQGYMTDDMLTPDYMHWLYTAFTRATERLFLVNWPQAQVEA